MYIHISHLSSMSCYFILFYFIFTFIALRVRINNKYIHRSLTLLELSASTEMNDIVGYTVHRVIIIAIKLLCHHDILSLAAKYGIIKCLDSSSCYLFQDVSVEEICCVCYIGFLIAMAVCLIVNVNVFYFGISVSASACIFVYFCFGAITRKCCRTIFQRAY